MICSQCQERDAVVHLTQIVENSVTQVHLCERCAAERGIETASSAPLHPLGEFLQAAQQQAAQLPGDAARCSYCGTSIRDFRASGRLGCARCYGAFENSLRDLLRRVHGSAVHVGRGYATAAAEEIAGAPEPALTDLRERLAAAIREEEFELAATLRDQIRTLE
ncbi:MAG: UvrB/UvrC motif-containing protein [Gemmatimonadaceae bacterium]|nr:UvrB/UvrC motif-containing protein [Gemmatimonadaceae bacterium]